MDGPDRLIAGFVEGVGKRVFLEVGDELSDAPLRRIRDDEEHDARQYGFVQQQNVRFPLSKV
jgi:hypothetical protein